MKCFKPLQGYRVFPPDDRPYVTFKDKFKTNHRTEAIEVRCANCIGCRLSKARDWAVRINHEASQHKENSFITLTYEDKHLPTYGGLDPDHWTSFINKLRKSLPDKKIRYYMCGEYGTNLLEHNQLGRPHFHAIIFGHDFSDDRIFFKERNGNDTYLSPRLDKAWGKGASEIGSVTMESAGYVAGYVVKKINGDSAKDHYMRVDQESGEFVRIKPEFARMSRGQSKGSGGIGRGWYEKYHDDLAKGFLTINGQECAIPQFYKKILKDRNPEVAERIEEEQKKSIKKQDRWNLEAEERQTIKTQSRMKNL